MFTERERFGSFSGMSQEQAPGFAAALDRLMAQGGNLRETKKGMVYTKGRLKGMTVDEAQEYGKNLWSGAADSVKDKYAYRARDFQAPSERVQEKRDMSYAGMRQRRMQGYADAQSSRMGSPGPLQQDMDRRNPAKSEKPRSMFDELTDGPAIPDGGALSIGDGSSAENGYTPQTKSDGTKLDGGIVDQSQISRAIPTSNPDMSSPVSRAVEGVGEMIGNAATSVANFVTSPFRADVNAAKSAKVASDNQAAYKARLDSEAKARQAEIDKVNGVSTPEMPETSATAGMSTDDRMRAEGKVNPRGSAANNAPVNTAPSAPVMGTGTPGKAPRINSLTGLPMGYRPGDALPQGASSGMQGTASASVGRQQAATAAYQGPIPKATLAPAADRYADAQNRYQAGQLDPKIANEMDTIYKGAGSEDQAKITANSLKRAAALPTTANAPKAVPVSRFAGPSTPRRAVVRR